MWFLIKRSNVVAAEVIRPLDGHTHWARSAVAYLGIWRKRHDCSWRHSTDSQCALMSPSDIFACLQLLDRNWKVGLHDPLPAWSSEWRRGSIARQCVLFVLLAPHWYIWSFSCRFELLRWLQKLSARQTAHPTRIWCQLPQKFSPTNIIQLKLVVIGNVTVLKANKSVWNAEIALKWK